mmetsp:Transcript_15642/g.28066  ORF Transcript_15642/g.28066 Transcript_15642/m.28066 type:complete len:448 (+) Transcript_15642:168-1511(+)|eukprot:CAMPEP_0196129768 /NCGR_PEP_ID=MMETSP0910-20130528/371_1 /TAXON_ID=49265 /ORGANISM="Thalassiosira rotula, Strain GSO102" /LENGTH=447 /DNA_ID=CAMNT_0041388943 /DNA_START=131 /DNA_END=1474 /DNA_ORIENTATION=+
MRSKAPSSAWCLSLVTLALLPPSTTASTTKTFTKSTRTRTRRRRHTAGPSSPSSRVSSELLHANSSEATLRERWVDLLSHEHDNANDSVRLGNRREETYYYEAELLADKLLGVDDLDADPDDEDIDKLNNDISLLKNSDDLRTTNSLLSQELSLLWKSIVITSSIVLIGITLAPLINTMLTSPLLQTTFASIQSSITPYLIPTFSILTTTLRNYAYQAQAILHSTPYLLRHLHHIKLKPLPFLYKLIRKCIIVEAWRHVWVRVYQVTRYLWIGTLTHANKAYVRWCPAWIRRGIKSYFQSMVQAQVQGVVGGVVGSLMGGGITFESWAWSSSSFSTSSSSSGDSSDSGSGEGSSGMEDVMMDSAAQSLENALQDVIVESIPDEGASAAAMDAMMEDVLDSVAEETIMDAILADSAAESSMESAMESFVDDCLSEGGCVDQVMESVSE